MKSRFILLTLAAFASFAVVGCSGGATTETTETVRNKDGEIEGKEPSFKMVPSQKDPNYQGKQ